MPEIYLTLEDGSLELNDTQIIIYDEASSRRKSKILIAIFFSLQLAVHIKKVIHKYDSDNLFFLLIYLIGVVILLFNFKDLLPVKNHLPLSEIKSVTIITSERHPVSQVYFYLKNARRRKIALSAENNQWDTLKSYLLMNKIPVSK